VTSAGLDDYITSIVRAYLRERDEDETFASWAIRADEESLRGQSDHRVLAVVS